MVIFADSHCHLNLLDSKQLNQIKDYKSIFFSSGYDQKSNEQNNVLQSKFSNVYATFGIAPQTAIFWDKPDFFENLDKWIDWIHNNIKNAKAIGEVGLDFFYAKSDDQIKRQEYTFEKMIELSEKYALPLVLHSRQAEEQCLDLLISSRVKNAMFHFYSGSPDLSSKITDNGFFISVPPLRSKKRKKTIIKTDLPFLLIETDGPYITKDLAGSLESARMISKYKSIDFEEVVLSTYKNACNFFKVFPNENNGV